MARKDKGSTKKFREMTFTEQANSITATIRKLQAMIEHHVSHSPHRSETIEESLGQIDRLAERVREIDDRGGTRPGFNQALPAAEEVPRLRIMSPRLANPERAVDFEMQVAEETRDASVR